MASNKKEPVKNTLAISINLLPPEYRKKQKDFTWVTDRRIIWPTVAAIVAIVAVLVLQAFINETISGLSACRKKWNANVRCFPRSVI